MTYFLECYYNYEFASDISDLFFNAQYHEILESRSYQAFTLSYYSEEAVEISIKIAHSAGSSNVIVKGCGGKFYDCNLSAQTIGGIIENPDEMINDASIIQQDSASNLHIIEFMSGGDKGCTVYNGAKICVYYILVLNA